MIKMRYKYLPAVLKTVRSLNSFFQSGAGLGPGMFFASFAIWSVLAVKYVQNNIMIATRRFSVVASILYLKVETLLEIWKICPYISSTFCEFCSDGY
jgi:hypothetical protein